MTLGRLPQRGNGQIFTDLHNPPTGTIPLGIVLTRLGEVRACGIQQSALDQHLLISGQPGSGKSALLTRIAISLESQAGMLVLDPGGKLFEQLGPRLPSPDLVVVDFSNRDRQPAFNPLDCSLDNIDIAVDVAAAVLGEYLEDEALRSLSDSGLRALAAANAHSPGGRHTIFALGPLLGDPSFGLTLIDNLNDSNLKQDLIKILGEGSDLRQWDEDERKGKLAPLMTALVELARSPFFSALASSNCKLDPAQLMHEGKTVLVRLPATSQSMRAMTNGLLCALIAGQHHWADRGCYLIIDDIQDSLGRESLIPDLVELGSGWKLRMLMAARNPGRLPEEPRKRLLVGSGSLIVLSGPESEHELLAPFLSTNDNVVEAEELAGLANYQFVASLTHQRGEETGRRQPAFAAQLLEPLGNPTADDLSEWEEHHAREIERHLSDQQSSDPESVIKGLVALGGTDDDEDDGVYTTLFTV